MFVLYSRVIVYITKALGWALAHSQGNDGVIAMVRMQVHMSGQTLRKVLMTV